jgi:V/A-type H+/Na+-transporting ATPase subunit I
MAIAKIKKIEIIATTEHKNKLFSKLQEFGNLQIIDKSESKGSVITEEQNSLQKVELNFANVEYAIKTLTPFAEKRGFLAGPITLSEKEILEIAEKYDVNSITEKCYEIEEKLTKAKNELNYLKNEYNTYLPWKNLKLQIQNLAGTKNVGILAGNIKTLVYQDFLSNAAKISNLVEIEKVAQDEKNTFFIIIFDREQEKAIRNTLAEYKFFELEAPNVKGSIKDYLHDLDERIKENKKTIDQQHKKLTEIAKELDNLKTVHDYLGWQKEKMETMQKLLNTQASFVVHGYIPQEKIETLEKEIATVTQEYCVSEIPFEENETPPVIISNSNLTSPFEALTRMYGLPKYQGLDPTPYLSVFFIIFFALCLTDAGYGIVMFIIMALALKYVKMGIGAKRLIKLLMYGGIVTTFIGAIFGGWFGFLPEEAPGFLTYTTASGQTMFVLQRINAISDPITVLVIALSLGFIQLVFGVYIRLVHNFLYGNRLDAILDSGTWAFMLTGIGFLLLAVTGVIPEFLQPVGKWWVISGAVLLVLTQGRDKKNILLKLMSGILSLYGLVGYLSDVLSYSRLLALGLATSIIALAVNVIVGLMLGIPYIGWLLAIIVFVGGHTMNLLINALGSFVHSSRLQFVEFFGKFMETGGKEFQPFDKKNKYLYIKN